MKRFHVINGTLDKGWKTPRKRKFQGGTQRVGTRPTAPKPNTGNDLV